MNFAKNLKLFREKFNVSQQYLADQINVSRTTITKYEMGAQEPNITNLIKLANVLNVSVDELVGNIYLNDYSFNYSLLNKLSKEKLAALEKLLE